MANVPKAAVHKRILQILYMMKATVNIVLIIPKPLKNHEMSNTDFKQITGIFFLPAYLPISLIIVNSSTNLLVA